MPSRQISDLCEELQLLAVSFLAEVNGSPVFKKAGAHAFLTCTYRSDAEQDALYAKARTAPGRKVTNARTGQSAHNCTEGQKPAARAFDFAVQCSDGSLDWNAHGGLWRAAVDIGRGIGLESGEKWGDSAHFQLKDWRKVV